MIPVLKIAKEGFDSKTAQEKDLSFTSERNCLKILEDGIVTSDSSGNITISHGLNRFVSFFVFYALNSNLSEWFPAFGVDADQNNIYINTELGETIRVYYMLNVDQL